MKLTAKVKLLTTPEQHASLMATLERANEACNYMSQVAWDTKTFRQFSLHGLVYYHAKDTFSLSSQMVIRCEAKVADAYKLDKKALRTFKPHGAIAYDARILKWKLDKFSVSIWTLSGRQEMLFSTGERQLELLKFQQGESDLVYVRGSFYLLATCSIPEPTPEDVEGYLGVDAGIVNLATDSLGNTHAGAHVNKVRRKRRRLRKSLQKCGSRSAKRKLKKLSGREARFAKDVNHCIGKNLVATSQCNRLGLAFEDLKHIHKRVQVRRGQQDDLHSWAFHQLQNFAAYKAQRVGVPTVWVDPRNTSRTCSRCGHCDKANRQTQAVFLCRSCGYAADADHNAAVNIAARAAINRPIVERVVSKSAPATSHLQAAPI